MGLTLSREGEGSHGRGWGTDTTLPTVGEDVQIHSIRRMNSAVLRELPPQGCTLSSFKSHGIKGDSQFPKTGKWHIAIFKKGKREHLGNYRPVSLISVYRKE